MNKPYNIHFILYSLLFLITCGFTTQALAQAPEMSPQFIKVGQKRISRTVYELTFKTTLINHDTPIKNVTATVTSTSPHTIIMSDNTVSFNDLAANETATSVDTFTLRQDMKFPYNPDDIHWDIQYDVEPTIPQIKAWFDTWNSKNTTIVVGESKSIVAAVNLRNKDNSEILVNLTQTISPANGISLSPHFANTTKVFNSPGYKKFSQQLSAQSTGVYTITTQMTEPVSGKTDTYIRKVTVIEPDALDVGITFSFQEYIPVGFNGELDVGATVAGKDYLEVSSVTLKILETGETAILPKKRTAYYRGSIPIDAQDMAVGDCLSLQIVIHSTKDEKTSEIKKVCVTGFPMSLGNDPQVFIETSNGVAIALDQLVVRFREGTSEARIREILSTVGGEVVGTATDLIFFRVGFTTTTSEELNLKRNQLRSFPEVESAEFNLRFGGIQSVLPANDPFLAFGAEEFFGTGSARGQNLPFKSRADEAWFVVQGDLPVAIIDTGIDLTGHPDLAGKILAGKNFVAGEDELYPHDRHGHGTHVAGIIAANSNNTEGVTGFSWNSPLLPVKITPDSGNFWYDVVVDGLKYATTSLEEPRLINASLGIPDGAIDPACEAAGANCDRRSVINAICREVTAASGKNITVVGAAGNDFRNEKNYPAACNFGLAIGATGAFDEILIANLGLNGSNYGDWVDLAAPGLDILSTVTSDPDCQRCEGDGRLYNVLTGTSQAAPAVTGALAVLFKRHPEWMNDPDKAVKRLKDTAHSHQTFSGIVFGLGAGRIDLFEAVFNGDFELKEENPNRLAEWKHKETSDAFLHCKAVSFFGNITPPKGEKMLSCGTQGVYEFNTSIPSAGSSVKNRINLPEGVTHLPLSFKWKVASVDLSLSRQTVLWDDRITFRLRRVDDPSKEVILFDTSLNRIMNNGRHLSASFIYPFVETDWTLDSYAHPIPYGAGEYELIIGIADRYDNVGDTYLFVDDLQFRLR